MSRRMSSLVLVAVMVGALIAASCSTTPPTPAASEKSTASTKPYGGLTVGDNFGTITSLYSPADTSMAQHGVASGIYDSLAFKDSSGQLKPGIAERWEMSSDGLSHTFYIRKGVKFHDGSDLTGADVKFSIEALIGPESIQGGAADWRAAVARVELKDDYTVVLHMKGALFELLPNIESSMGVVMPKKYIEEKGIDYYSKNPIGSGPWKVVRYVPMGRLEIEAVESHWRAVPKFKNVTILHVPEEATKVAMLKTGELDMGVVSPDSVPTLKAAGLSTLNYDTGSQSFVYVFYDLEHPEQYALGDVRVRKALQLAINNREMIDKLMGGYGEPYAVYNAPKNVYFFDPNVLKVDPYDPEGAKKLLAQTGYPNGFKTRIIDQVGGGILNSFGAALSGYWQKIGVTADIVPLQMSVIRSMYAPKHKPEIWNSLYAVSGAPAIGFERMAIAYHSTRGSGKTTKNARLDELIDKVPKTADPAERKRLALEAAVIAKNEYGVLTLIQSHTVLAFDSKRIGGMVPFQTPAPLIKGVTYETIAHAK